MTVRSDRVPLDLTLAPHFPPRPQGAGLLPVLRAVGGQDAAGRPAASALLTGSAEGGLTVTPRRLLLPTPVHIPAAATPLLLLTPPQQ